MESDFPCQAKPTSSPACCISGHCERWIAINGRNHVCYLLPVTKFPVLYTILAHYCIQDPVYLSVHVVVLEKKSYSRTHLLSGGRSKQRWKMYKIVFDIFSPWIKCDKKDGVHVAVTWLVCQTNRGNPLRKNNIGESDWFGGHSVLIFNIFYHIWYDDTLWRQFYHFWLFGLISMNQSKWFFKTQQFQSVFSQA